MTYAVIWKLTAIQQLGRVRAAAADPVAVDRAAALVDYLLRRAPRSVGESRAPGYRLWFEDMLAVYYMIDEAAKRVDVLLVGPARRH